MEKYLKCESLCELQFHLGSNKIVCLVEFILVFVSKIEREEYLKHEYMYVDFNFILAAILVKPSTRCIEGY